MTISQDTAINYDLTSLSGRVAFLASKVGGGAELARRADMSQSTLSRITRGYDTTVGNLLKIFDAVEDEGITLDWLLKGKGSPDSFLPTADKTKGHIKIKQYGQTEADLSIDETACPILFEEYWFKIVVCRFPKRCFAFQATDSEIKPIRQGSWTIIDTGSLEGDGVYAIKIKNALQIRQLQFMPTGGVRILTHGESFTDYVLTEEQLQLIQILGRVVWWESH